MNRNISVINGWTVTQGDYISPEDDYVKKYIKRLKKEKIENRIFKGIALTAALAALLEIMYLVTTI